MKIKKYEVSDMKEALRLIKQDLGPEAVILTTRKIMKPAGLGLFPKPILEVTAAVDYDKNIFRDKKNENPKIQSDPGSFMPPDPTASSTFKRGTAEYRRDGSTSDSPYFRPEPPSAGREAVAEPEAVSIKRNFAPRTGVAEAVFTKSILEDTRTGRYYAEGSAASLLPAPGEEPYIPPPAKTQEKTTDNLIQVLSSMGLGSLATDINDIKKQLNEMKASIKEPVNIAVELPANMKEIYGILIRNGLDELLAYRFLKSIEKSVSDSVSKAQIKSALVERIAESVPVENGYLELMKGKIIGFIGPTGVGKTTTIAKIAANLVLKQTQKACLITVDNFRVGAVEQLKTYAEIVKLPLYVASSAHDLERLLNNIYSQYEYILLDSTGRSPYDINKLNETAQYLNAHPGIIPVLVLSMAANHMELGEMYERYSGLDPKYLIFTKLDETRYFGPLANIPVKKKIPLMLLSAGQGVPDDIEIPDGRKIARKLLQEIPVLWNDN